MEFTYFSMPYLNREVASQYKDIGGLGYMFASWLYNFYSPIKDCIADGGNPCELDKRNVFFDGETRRYYIQISTSFIIDQFGVFGLDTERKVGLLIDKLNAPDCGEPLLGVKHFGSTKAKNRIRAVCPTKKLGELVGSKNYISTNTATPTPASNPTEYQFSPECLKFIDAVQDIPKLAGKSINKVRGEGFTKSAIDADKYIRSLLDGTFVEKFAGGFSKPVKQGDLDSITLDDIIRCVHEYNYTMDKMEFSTAIISYNGKFSPLVNQYLKTKDTKVAKFDIEKASRKMKLFFGYDFPEGRVQGFNDSCKINNDSFHRMFKPYDERLAKIFEKAEEYCDDFDIKDLDVSRLMKYYILYLKSKDAYAETQLANDIDYIRMGDHTNTNFRAFAIYCALRNGVFITPDSGFNKWLKDIRAKNDRMSNYDISRFTIAN